MNIDNALEEAIEKLHEEKYKLRVYETTLVLKIDSEYGVEETLQDVRSIDGVTVVTAIDSVFRDASDAYHSLVKIKFHPPQDTMTPESYMKKILTPTIRSAQIPGTSIVKLVKKPEQIEA